MAHPNMRITLVTTVICALAAYSNVSSASEETDELEKQSDQSVSQRPAMVVGRKNSIGIVKLPIGTHGVARRGLVLI